MTTRELIERLTDATANTTFGLQEEIIRHLEASTTCCEEHTMFLIRLIGDIRIAMGDREGRLMLEEIAPKLIEILQHHEEHAAAQARRLASCQDMLARQNKAVMRLETILSKDGKQYLIDENNALRRELDEAKKSLAEGKGE